MHENFIDPAVFSSIASLELIARKAVEGAVSGLHHSHYLGRNVEFSEHRPYNPGDELRYIDWRVYAKTDRFHVKQFEEDTNLRVLILTDLSGSMNFADSTVSKAHYARQLTAAYDAESIRAYSRSLGHVPIIDRNPRRGEKEEMDPATKERYKERTNAERVFSRFKEEFGGNHVRVRGAVKVMAHLMFGLVALTADQLLRLVM